MSNFKTSDQLILDMGPGVLSHLSGWITHPQEQARNTVKSSFDSPLKGTFSQILCGSTFIPTGINIYLKSYGNNICTAHCFASVIGTGGAFTDFLNISPSFRESSN